MLIHTIFRRGVSAVILIPAVLVIAACASDNAFAPTRQALSGSAAAKLRSNVSPPASCAAGTKQDLYISTDPSTSFGNVLGFCNEEYVQVRDLTDGINHPDGLSADTSGNLYVASYGYHTIVEYAPGKHNTPFFTYSAGISWPDAVTVDTHGNVFEGDYESGVVNEYAQTTNSVVASCTVGTAVDQASVYGVAVDSAGDVFVSYNDYNNDNTQLGEYKRGLAGCNLTAFPLTFDHGQGIALDKNRNLLVADGQQVYIVDPPYTSISGTLQSGFSDAISVSLSKNNKLAFVGDIDAGNVWILSYPSGTLQEVINHLASPWGVVDVPNAVY